MNGEVDHIWPQSQCNMPSHNNINTKKLVQKNLKETSEFTQKLSTPDMRNIIYLLLFSMQFITSLKLW